MRGGGAWRAAEGGAVGGSGVPGRIGVLKHKKKTKNIVKPETLPIEYIDLV